MLGTPPSNSSEDNNNKYLSVIGSASGAGLFAVLVIIVAVSCIVVMMRHKNRRSEHIYEAPPFLSATPTINTVIINSTHNTGEAGATNVMSMDTQDHRALHSSNCDTTNIHDSAHLYNGSVTTTTTIATENIIEGNIQVDTTSDDHTDIVDESHTTTCSSQFAETNKQIGEGKYAPITSPSSDIFPVVDESCTSKVFCSTQAFNGVKPTGGDECATINQQQNLNCDASVNQVHDAQLSHADNNAGSNIEGM